MRKLISLMAIFLTTSSAPITAVACSNGVINISKLLGSNPDLGQINTKGKEKPTTDELDQAFNEKYQNKINVTALKLGTIANDQVTVTGDGITYSGTAVVKFSVQQQHILITDIITEDTILDNPIATEGKLQPDDADIKKALKNEYPNLNTEKIQVKTITDPKAKPQEASITGKDKDPTYVGKVSIYYNVNRLIELNKVITDPNLGSIVTSGQDKPTSDDIKKALKAKYPNLCLELINVQIITETSAVVSSADPSVYTGPAINLTFVIDLNTVLTNTNLYQIHIDPKAKLPTESQVKTALKVNGLNKNLNLKYVNVDNITTTSAVVSSTDQSVYKGDPITVTYTLNQSTDLSDIIPQANRDLGTFKFDLPKTAPVAKDITDKLQSYSLEIDKLKVANITATSAVVSSTDSSVYTGSVTLTYKVDNSVTLDSVLVTKDLGTVNTNGLPTPANEAVVTAIAKSNPNVTSAYIKVDKITNNSALVTGDTTHYTGSLTVTFKIDSSTITNAISYQDNHDYAAEGGGTSNSFDGKEQVILSNWTNYAPTWDAFTKAFPKLSFGKDATFYVWMVTCDDKELKGDQLTFDTNKITTDKTNKAFTLGFHYNYDPVWVTLWSADLNAYITIWHDDKNVYVNWHGSAEVSKACTRDSQFSVNLPEVDFHQ